VSERLPTKRPGAGHNATTIARVTPILEGYAEKAVFRGFSAHPKRGGKAVYQLVWHFDRRFELLLDVPGRTLTFPNLLPGVPVRSEMYRELKAFIQARESEEAPEHRRVDRTKARLKLINERGVVSVALTVKDGDFEYAARKLIQVVHEIFVGFLIDGPYFDYTVEQLGLDPDIF
jgi:hypothetical protein